MRRPLVLALVALLAAGCGGSGRTVPRLTRVELAVLGDGGLRGMPLATVTDPAALAHLAPLVPQPLPSVNPMEPAPAKCSFRVDLAIALAGARSTRYDYCPPRQLARLAASLCLALKWRDGSALRVPAADCRRLFHVPAGAALVAVR